MLRIDAKQSSAGDAGYYEIGIMVGKTNITNLGCSPERTLMQVLRSE